VLNTKGENINLCWSPDGNTIAVGNKTDQISFFDVRTNKLVAEKEFNQEINEIRWNKGGDLFFLTTGDGTIKVLTYPDLAEPCPAFPAHTANCICLNFDPKGKYFATGSADTLTSLWSASELICIRTFGRSEWPIRTLSFSYDGQLLAGASEDELLKLTYVETGEVVHQIATPSGSFTLAWHPNQLLLAFAGGEKSREGSAGIVRLFGHPKSRD
jgi:THO complex subunit 3